MRLENPTDKLNTDYEAWVEKNDLEFSDATLRFFNSYSEIEDFLDGLDEQMQASKDLAAEIRRGREMELESLKLHTIQNRENQYMVELMMNRVSEMIAKQS